MDKIIIDHPDNFIPERRYILETLFETFAGIPRASFELRPSGEIKDYHIHIGDGELIVEDHFFSNLSGKSPVNKLYKKENLPGSPAFMTYNNISYPILYGSNKLLSEENTIILGLDIFASSFLMLSRWPESLEVTKDKEGRFPSERMIPVLWNFEKTPVVNNYAQMLISLIQQLKPNYQVGSRTFRLIPTHDIDHLIKWRSLRKLLECIYNYTVRNTKPGKAWRNTVEFLMSKTGRKNDPYDSFDYLINKSLEENVTSRFYFMSGGSLKKDSSYKPEEIRSLLQKLLKQEQIIGFHPSYESIHHPDMWQQELKNLQKISGTTIQEGRQHYLRFEVPGTWRLWEDNQLKIDSSMGFTDRVGFRTGSCYAYPVFDISRRKKLNLMEQPLIMMDVAVMTHMKLSPQEFKKLNRELIKTVKHYNGDFTFLWHNSSLFTVECTPYVSVYEDIFKASKEN